MNNHNSKSRKAWLGIFLVSLGAYFLLRNLGLIPSFIPWYLFGWEMVFILIGGSMLVSGKKEGLIFLAIGGLSILPEIFYWWPHTDLRDLWPIILIAIGISIFTKRRKNESGSNSKHENDDDFLDESVLFGGSEKSFTSQNFKGGKVTTIFGGSEINFANAKMASEEVILDVNCAFGGIAFVVPSDWTVVNDSTVIFGEFADKRPNSTIQTNDPNKVLRIKGSVAFGGAEIKGA